jgi:transcriptional regulator of acetoin/glycerol metabolism
MAHLSAQRRALVCGMNLVEREYMWPCCRRMMATGPKPAEQLGIGAATLYRKLKQYGADQ